MIASLGYAVLVVASLAALTVVGFLIAAAFNARRPAGCELCNGIGARTLRRWGACPDCGRSGGVL